jgi:predicted dehydrogenase
VEQLRWGILSTARIATTKVVPATRRAANSEVVAIGSRDRGRAEAAARQLGIPAAYGSYEAVLADDEVDAVYLPLPNHLHAEWAIAAARAGKHVLCEKPLAVTTADARAMVEAADAAGVRLMEAFMYRLHPMWDTVAELIASGRIGALQHVHSWFSYFNDDPDDIRNQVAAGGGGLLDIGGYCVDATRLVVGREPDEVTGVVRRDPELGVDTRASATLRFGDVTATFTCSTRAKKDQHLVIHGTTGRIAVAAPFNVAPDLPSEVQLVTGDDLPAHTEPETFTFDPVDTYTLQAERFAAAVLDGADLPTPPSDGIATLAVLERLAAVG